MPYSPNSQHYFSLGPVGVAGTFMKYQHIDQAMVSRGKSYQGWDWTVRKITSWDKTTIDIWPSKGVKTFRDTRSAVGRLRESVGYGPVQPTVSAVSMGLGGNVKEGATH